MTEVRPSRRERLRAEATAEIKAIALRHVEESGAGAVSLRAVAREMGMTPGALYSYFPTRDALLITLVAEVYESLADTLEEAVAAAGPDPAARVLRYGRAYRRWAKANPARFRLVYGDPVPGHTPAPVGGPVAEAEHRACVLLTGLVAAAWPLARTRHEDDPAAWTDFDPGFARAVATEYPELPPAAVALALRVWGRLHGLVSLEVYGHLTPQIRDASRLFEPELRDLLRLLNLPVPRREPAAT